MGRDLPTLGVGIGFREPFLLELFRRRDDVDFLEITADHYFDAPEEKRAELDLLADHFPIIPHGLDLSLGSAEGIDADYLESMAGLIARLDPPWWSEHIAYTRAGGVSIGHLAPLPWTHEAVDVVARNVDKVRHHIDVPLILENITATVVLPGTEMDEVGFLTAVLDRTGCGFLCDVTNLYTNAINLGLDLEEMLDRWPWDRVVQLHFAGGHWHDGSLVDSHAQATPPEVWGVLEVAVERAQVRGIILERDENLPPFDELLGELEQGTGNREAAPSMGLAEVQAALAKLYVDEALRDRFFDDPAAVGSELGLEGGEARSWLASRGTRSNGSPARSGVSVRPRCVRPCRWPRRRWAGGSRSCSGDTWPSRRREARRRTWRMPSVSSRPCGVGPPGSSRRGPWTWLATSWPGIRRCGRAGCRSSVGSGSRSRGWRGRRCGLAPRDVRDLVAAFETRAGVAPRPRVAGIRERVGQARHTRIRWECMSSPTKKRNRCIHLHSIGYRRTRLTAPPPKPYLDPPKARHLTRLHQCECPP